MNNVAPGIGIVMKVPRDSYLETFTKSRCNDSGNCELVSIKLFELFLKLQALYERFQQKTIKVRLGSEVKYTDALFCQGPS